MNLKNEIQIEQPIDTSLEHNEIVMIFSQGIPIKFFTILDFFLP